MSIEATRRRVAFLSSYYDASLPPAAASAVTTATRYDPGEHTVAEVEAHVAKHPGDRDRILAAERKGKGRVTLLAALDPEDEEDGDE